MKNMQNYIAKESLKNLEGSILDTAVLIFFTYMLFIFHPNLLGLLIASLFLLVYTVREFNRWHAHKAKLERLLNKKL